ncbi:Heavy metal-associated isoprenylated plant protein, partial [Thalictrum thalictroides]
TVVKMYSNGKSNLENLKKLGATIIHGVDATNMKMHTDLLARKFDRIIFNFPHAGFYGKEDHQPLILKHRTLVRGFFKNASDMLRPDGEVHVNHKTTAPFTHWSIEELATGYCLKLTECIEFKKGDYPGYSNKRGASDRCDEPFPLGECSTFKFRLVPGLKKQQPKVIPVIVNTGLKKKKPKVIPEIGNTEANVPDTHIQIQYPGFPQAANTPPNVSTTVGLPPINNGTPDCLWIFQEYFKHANIMFGRGGYNVRQVTYETLDAGFDRYMTGPTRRDSNEFIMHLEELHRLSQLRLKWLQAKLLLKED